MTNGIWNGMTGAHDFKIEELPGDDVLTVRLLGELDIASADRVAARLDSLAASGQAARLDLDDLSFMDSSGLRVVLQATQQSRATGWAFSITPGSDQVRRLFDAAGVTSDLPIER